MQTPKHGQTYHAWYAGGQSPRPVFRTRLRYQMLQPLKQVRTLAHIVRWSIPDQGSSCTARHPGHVTQHVPASQSYRAGHPQGPLRPGCHMQLTTLPASPTLQKLQKLSGKWIDRKIVHQNPQKLLQFTGQIRSYLACQIQQFCKPHSNFQQKLLLKPGFGTFLCSSSEHSPNTQLLADCNQNHLCGKIKGNHSHNFWRWSCSLQSFPMNSRALQCDQGTR